MYSVLWLKQSIVVVEPGGITFEQRFGSGLQFNWHMHTLMLDGIYLRRADGSLVFQNIKLETKDIQEITSHIARRVIKLLNRRGYIKKDGALRDNPLLGPELAENPELAKLTAAAASGKVLFGSVVKITNPTNISPITFGATVEPGAHKLNFFFKLWQK